jgi:hypothetical protein
MMRLLAHFVRGYGLRLGAIAAVATVAALVRWFS